MTMPPTPSPRQTFWNAFHTFAHNYPGFTPAQKRLIPNNCSSGAIVLFNAPQKSIILYHYNNAFVLRLWWHRAPQPQLIQNERTLINSAKQNNPIWNPLSVPLARNRVSASTTNTIEWDLKNVIGTFNTGSASASWNALYSSPNINRLFQRACDFLVFLCNAGINF